LNVAIFENEGRRKINYWSLWAVCCVIGGALLGVMFVGFFVRGPHWVFNLSAIAFGYGGGALGAQLYKWTAREIK